MSRRRNQNQVLDGLAPRSKNGSTIFSRRKTKKVTDLDELTDAELGFAVHYAAVLKAVGYSWRYISDTLNIQTSLVKSFAEEEEWDAAVAKVSSDVVEGGLDHLKNHTVELVEMLLEHARVTTDDAVRLKAIEAGLDRVGLAKVNKSESRVTKDESVTEKHTHSFSEEFMERLEGMPVETQKRLVQLMQEADELMVEGSQQG